jgi:very-short-patch-repair endonuclease
MGKALPTPPRHGEGDRSAQPNGGGAIPAGLRATRKAIRIARRERRSNNLPEILLWRELRKRPGGFKFRRQHPFADYAMDFAHLPSRLCIEIDGEAHARGARPGRDERRDRELAAAGFRTLRIPASDLLSDLESVLTAILAACGQPLHHRAVPGGPPPRTGEV